jgi:hypothetical protein
VRGQQTASLYAKAGGTAEAVYSVSPVREGL